jgi:uncharacterized protein
MQTQISRRDLLKYGAATAAAPTVLKTQRAAGAVRSGKAVAASGYPSSMPVPASWVVKPFANTDVTLADSLFTANRDRVLNFLNTYSADRMLAIFRTNAGLDAMGAQPPGGWETADGNLRGHYAGHFLSALALAYAAGSGDAYKTKSDYMVTALGQCQDALAAQVGQTPSITRVPGKSGSALKLSGSSQYVALPANIVSTLTDFTVSLWVNPAATTAYSRLFDFGANTTKNMYLAINAGSGPRFAITTGGSAGEQQISRSGQLPTGTWTHIAVTLSDGTGTMYVNGAVAATKTGMTLTPSSLGATANNWIGRSQYSDPYLNGTVDEFNIYDRALSAAEVASLSGGAAGAGNVASYRFDEADGATATDSSGAGRDATIMTGQGPGPSYPGYLAAYPETQYILLEQYATYPTIWAPWYTCHMIMRGLVDAYLYTGNEQALTIVLKMADWAHSRLAKLPRAQLDRMWGIYIAGEYNAMPVVLADLYALTGDAKHLETAKCFINTALYQATVENTDVLDGRHANQHIPQFMGYLEIFEQTEEPDFFAAASNFWDMVVKHRTYTDGGMAGKGEIFGARDVIAATISTKDNGVADNAETCPVYNMLKLSRSLFFHTGDPEYMQYYERALYGQILSSRRNTDSGTNPLLTYFVEMGPGRTRSYDNLGTCCGGTGLETHVKFQDSIYFQAVDGKSLFVNLYMPSKLAWAEKGIAVEQSTDYPTDPSGDVLIKVTGSGSLDIKLRVPYWVQKGFSVKLNGELQSLDAEPGTYVTLSRTWASGDTIAVSAPFSLRVEKTLDQPRVTQALAYGPVPMVALSPSTDYQQFTLDADLTHSVTPAADAMTFTTNGLTLRPFYIDDTTAYHAYFHRVNRAPAVADARTVTEGEALAFALGSDLDGDECTCTASPLPDGAAVDEAGVLRWTPRAGQAGTYALDVTVDDGLASTAGKVVVTVNPGSGDGGGQEGGGTPLPSASPAPSPTPAPVPLPAPRLPAAASAPHVLRTQRGTVVHGSVRLARARSRAEVDVMATRHALGERGKGDVRVGRIVHSVASAKTLSFAIHVNAAAKRALRKHGKLTLSVKLTVKPEAGETYAVTRTVTLHQ